MPIGVEAMQRDGDRVFVPTPSVEPTRTGSR
jgi:hypothetical protein